MSPWKYDTLQGGVLTRNEVVLTVIKEVQGIVYSNCDKITSYTAIIGNLTKNTECHGTFSLSH